MLFLSEPGGVVEDDLDNDRADDHRREQHRTIQNNRLIFFNQNYFNF